MHKALTGAGFNVVASCALSPCGGDAVVEKEFAASAGSGMEPQFKARWQGARHPEGDHLMIGSPDKIQEL
jgi:hypothetical protein